MKTQRMIILLLLFSLYSFGGEPGEKNIFSFNTEDGNLIEISVDTVYNKLTFKQYKGSVVELTVVDDLNDTKVVFKYSYYLRGGGIENAGLDLNFLSFTFDNNHYKVYQEYSAEDDKEYIGVIITNNSIERYLIGKSETSKGNLMEFRSNGLIPIQQE